MPRNPESGQRKLAVNKRPHPQHPRKTIKIKCLGHCGKSFLSADKASNRLCETCSRHTGGLEPQGHTGRRVMGKGAMS